ncbi:MAG: TspO/MBR family protein [Pseudomonadota bacterium]
MDWSIFIVFLAACCAAAATGSMFPPDKWYRKLNKPVWTPKDWMFPVAWTTLYVMSAYAATVVSVMEGSAMGMAFWALQIALNALWTPVFFGLKRIRTGMIVLVCLWISVLGTLVAFSTVSALAAWLMAPYLLWVTVAGALNAAVWKMNPGQVTQTA